MTGRTQPQPPRKKQGYALQKAKEGKKKREKRGRRKPHCTAKRMPPSSFDKVTPVQLLRLVRTVAFLVLSVSLPTLAENNDLLVRQQRRNIFQSVRERGVKDSQSVSKRSSQLKEKKSRCNSGWVGRQAMKVESDKK